MKFLLKIVSLILIGTLTISTLPVSAFAVNPIEVQNVDLGDDEVQNVDLGDDEVQNVDLGDDEVQNIYLGDGLEVSIEDSSEKRIAIYYENNIPKQEAILYKESGDIYYYDLNLQNDLSRNYSTNDNISFESYTKKYNIEDFIVNDTYNTEETIITKNSRATYTLLKSKIYDYVGQTYKRYLYGYKDEVQYQQNSWHFVVGTAITVICTVVGLIVPELAAKIASIVGAVGGITLGALTVQEWIKERFWVYKFSQTSPTIMEFVCGGRFAYEKQRKVQINGDTGYWETFYTESNLSIENTRSDILTYPGYYL